MPTRPPVVSSARKLSSWLIVLGGLVLYAAGVLVMHVSPVPLGVSLPWWVLQGAPLVVYGVIVSLVARPTAFRLLAGVAVLWAVHLALGTASWALLGMVDAGGPASWAFPPPPFPEILWVPLLLVPLRDVLGGHPRRHQVRAPLARDRRPAPERRTSAAPMPTAPRNATPLRIAPAAPSRAVPTAPAPPPVIAMEPRPIETRQEAEPFTDAAPPSSPDPVPSDPAPARAPEPAIVVAVPAADAPGQDAGDRLNDLLARDASAEPLRVSFDRVAAQLPSTIFTAPLERVAAELREPGRLLIHRRTALAQLETGIVRATWRAIADQFPAHVLVATAEEIADILPDGGQLVLPIDEIVCQLPPELFMAEGPEPDVRGIEEFPAPFQPLSTCDPSTMPQLQDEVAPRVAERNPRDATAALAADPEPDWDQDSDGEPAEFVDEVADLVPLGVATYATSAPREQELPGHDVARTLSQYLPRLGPLEIERSTVAGAKLVSVCAPGVGKEFAVTAARLVVPLLASADAPWAIEQVTLRSPDVAVVLTPVGAMSDGSEVLAAAIPPGGSLALVEMRCRQAAAEAAAGTRSAPAAVDDEHDEPDLLDVECSTRVQGLASRLDALGSVTASALRDAHADRLLYLFLPAGSDVRAVGAFAQKLARALEQAAATGVAFRTAVLRSGGRSVVIRPPAEGAARFHTIVAAGQTARPGLAYRQVEQAAVALGAT